MCTRMSQGVLRYKDVAMTHAVVSQCVVCRLGNIDNKNSAVVSLFVLAPCATCCPSAAGAGLV